MVLREEIVVAAQEVICQRGVTGCTTRQIAEAAGCSEGSIYNHFSSKADLIAEAVGDRFGGFPWQARALPERAGRATVEENLAELAGAAIGFFHQLVPMLGAMLGDPDSLRRRARALHAQGHGPRRVIQAVADYLSREQEVGRVRPDASVVGAAQCLIGGCLQQALLTHSWGAEFLALDDDAAATAIVRAVALGLQPHACDDDDQE